MSELTKFQKFEAVTVHRSQLKNAPYNPRTINDKARAKLKRLLKKNGLVETLVWNKRTGNLVGGHQRISILDDLEGNSEYSITVACVDIDLKAEKELNISLNNPNVQGEYNFDTLKAFGDIDWGNTGFEPAEISYFKADEVITGMEDDINATESEVTASLEGIKASPGAEDDEDDFEAISEAERKKQAIKAVKEKQKELKVENGEKFFVVTFRTVTEKIDFLEKYGFEKDDKYVDGYTLETIIKKGHG